ncbi:MAG TPA: PEGA domain-containing protein [Vicinamibacterales bacterium]
MTPTLRLRTALIAFLFSSFFALPTDVGAQPRRHVRPASRSVVVLGEYYRPFIYDPWYYPYYPYGWFPPYAYAQTYPPDSSLRLQVAPRETEVFVDRYYAGTVDDFDGFFQRLHLEPGEHEITLYLQGYRTAHQMIYLQPNGTFRIRHTMEALPSGAPPDPRPVSPPNPQRTPPPPRPGADAGPRATRAAGAATLAIRVQPADAEVLIDGERWEAPARDEQLVLEVVAGVHHIEIRRDGYRSYSSDIDVRSGETERLNISLSRQ